MNKFISISNFQQNKSKKQEKKKENLNGKETTTNSSTTKPFDHRPNCEEWEGIKKLIYSPDNWMVFFDVHFFHKKTTKAERNKKATNKFYCKLITVQYIQRRRALSAEHNIIVHATHTIWPKNCDRVRYW